MAMPADLSAQEAEVTNALVSAIKQCKDVSGAVINTPLATPLIDACKQAGQSAMQFKQMLQGARAFSRALSRSPRPRHLLPR